MLKMSRFTISSLTLTMLSVVSFFTITKTSTQNNDWISSIQGRFLLVYSTRPLPLSLPISISGTLAHLNLLIYFNDHAREHQLSFILIFHSLQQSRIPRKLLLIVLHKLIMKKFLSCVR